MKFSPVIVRHEKRELVQFDKITRRIKLLCYELDEIIDPTEITSIIASRIYEKITRYVVFLEDYKTGHFIQISDNVYTRYRAGDFVKWSGYTAHAAYNLGTEDRYTLQITCS